MKLLNKKEAAAALGISVRNFERRIQHGKIKGVTDSTRGQFGQKFYSYSTLGLIDPEERKASPADVPVNPIYEEPSPMDERSASSFVPRELSPREQKQLDDSQFAEAYKSGDATDSFGNRIGNAKVSLLGPVVESHEKPARQFGDSHMPEGMKAKAGTSGNDSVLASADFEERWHPGTKARTEKMYESAGMRKPSQQQAKQMVDIAVIRESFKHGYSR